MASCIRTALVAMACALAGAQSGHAQSGPAPMPIKVITSAPTLTVASHFTILAKGLDKKYGLAIETLNVGGSSTLMVDAVLSENALIGLPGVPTALQAIRAGADLKVIAAISNNQIAAVMRNETMQRVGVSPNASIADRMRALKGLTIASNPIGSTYYQVLRAYLKEYGLDPDNDVRLVPVGDASAMMSGMQQGRFDVVVTASGIVEQAIGMNMAALWFNAARGDFPGAEAVMVAVAVAKGSTIEKHKAEIDAYLAALKESMDSIRDDHDATGVVLKPAFFPKLDQTLWSMAWDQAREGYPKSLVFTKRTFDYWLRNDPKGPESYKDVDYRKITYAPAQSN